MGIKFTALDKTAMVWGIIHSCIIWQLYSNKYLNGCLVKGLKIRQIDGGLMMAIKPYLINTSTIPFGVEMNINTSGIDRNGSMATSAASHLTSSLKPPGQADEISRLFVRTRLSLSNTTPRN